MASAIQSAVERVIRQERAEFARRLALIHVAVGALGIPVAIVAAVTDGSGRYNITVLAVSGVFLVGFALMVLSRFPRWAPHLGWALPLVDVPIVSVAQIFQVDRLEAPWMSLTGVVGYAAGICAASVLSLSPRVVIATVALTGVHVVTRNIHLNVHPAPIAMCMIVWAGMGFALATVVGRIRKLVALSRRDDLLGKYVLGRRLGAGGMAEVYEATYSPEGGFERRVAVKKILPAFAQQDEAMRLFRREAELGAQLAHPNVVQVLDFGAVSDTYFLAMEYVDGAPLSAVLAALSAEGQRVPVAGVVLTALQLADALDYVHERLSGSGMPMGLVHRDVNPPNIMLTRGGDVKLADFGIARSAIQASVTAVGVLRGKLAYAAPEQILGQGYDSRADLYALGVTLHEMLTGRRLFTGTTEVEVLKACLESRVAPPESGSAELDALVLRLLIRDPAQRTQRASELLDELRSLPALLTDVHAGRRALADVVKHVPERPAAALAETPIRATDPQAETRTREVTTR